jgi:hypothetical protein
MRLDLKMPSTRPGSSVMSGLVGLHNEFGSQVLELFNQHKDGEAPGEGSSVKRKEKPNPEKWEKQRAINASIIHDINALANERRALVEAKGSSQAEKEAKKRDAEAAREAAARHEEVKRARNALIGKRSTAMLKSASGRVQLKLLELRTDDAARQELERRCESWKQARSDGKTERRNVLSENRAALRSMSTDDLLARRRGATAQWQEKRKRVQHNLQAIATERDLMRRAMEMQVCAPDEPRSPSRSERSPPAGLRCAPAFLLLTILAIPLPACPCADSRVDPSQPGWHGNGPRPVLAARPHAAEPRKLVSFGKGARQR